MLPVFRVLFAGVLVIVPSEAGLDLSDVDVTAVEQHLAHEALVFVAFGPFDDNYAAGDLVDEVLPGDSPVWLVEFRGITPCESDLVLDLSRIERSDRVAIVDADDGARQFGGVGWQNHCEQPYCEHKPCPQTPAIAQDRSPLAEIDFLLT
jgi:hypothetical protein